MLLMEQGFAEYMGWQQMLFRCPPSIASSKIIEPRKGSIVMQSHKMPVPRDRVRHAYPSRKADAVFHAPVPARRIFRPVMIGDLALYNQDPSHI